MVYLIESGDLATTDRKKLQYFLGNYDDPLNIRNCSVPLATW